MKISCHLRTWRASLTVNISYGVTHETMFIPFFLMEELVLCGPYYDMLQLFLVPQLQQEILKMFIFQ
jgi:hypothetical protein